MSKKEIVAATALAAGFVALVAGVALVHVPAAAITGGVLLMVLGVALDRAAS